MLTTSPHSSGDGMIAASLVPDRMPLSVHPELPESVQAFHTRTSDAWAAMLDACDQAEISICLEEYILHPDIIGSAFMDVFLRKARKGVSVRLLLDWWGCRELCNTSKLVMLEEAGVIVRFFRPPSIRWFSGQRFFPRDHRKILIIDETTAFIGGVCIYDKIRDWRDTMVEVSDGPVKQLSYIFEQTWDNMNAGYQAEQSSHPDFETDSDITIVANAPDADEHRFTRTLYNALNAARHSIRLTTPYFTPGDRFIEIVYKALARGVRVEILLSDSSKYAPYTVGKHIAGDLIRRGADIFYYQPSMLHLKMMIVDDEWASIGSCNLDGLSLHHNQEAMIVSHQPVFIATLQDHFSRDKAHSLPFTHAAWANRSLVQKLAGHALFPLKHYL